MLIAQILTRSDIMGGVQSHVRDLSEALRNRGHEPIIFIGGNGIFLDLLQKQGLRCLSIPHLVQPIRPYSDVRALLELISALRTHKPRLVCTHSAKAGWLGRAAASVCGIPSIFTPHGWSMVDRVSLRPKSYFRFAEIIAAFFTSKIINVCEYERSIASRNLLRSQHKLEVVLNGIPDVAARAKVALCPPTIIMVARYEKQKDHQTLLHAVAGLRDLRWRLTLVGDGSGKDAVRCLVSELQLDNRVEFLPSTVDVTEALARSQIFVLTTNFEAFPISILEAMRAGLPVVATDVGGVKEAVIEGITGLLVKKGDVRSVQFALRRLIVNLELRRRMSIAGRTSYARNFDVESMVDRTMRIYADATRRGI